VERAILDAEKVAGRSFYFGFGTARHAALKDARTSDDDST
jgi:Mor family transcriptional regulator